MEMNRTVLFKLQRAIELALRTVAQEHEVKIELSGCRFDPVEASFRLKISQSEDTAKDYFQKNALFAGAEPEWYGRQTMIRGAIFTVTGLAPGRSKNSIKITRQDGKAFVCPPHTIRAGLI